MSVPATVAPPLKSSDICEIKVSKGKETRNENIFTDIMKKTSGDKNNKPVKGEYALNRRGGGGWVCVCVSQNGGQGGGPMYHTVILLLHVVVLLLTLQGVYSQHVSRPTFEKYFPSLQG